MTMTTKEVIGFLGWEYNLASKLQCQKWARTGVLTAKKALHGWQYEEASVKKIAAEMSKKPRSYYTSREVADMLGEGMYTVQRFAQKGKLTGWRMPGSTKSQWRFPKMKALEEIEKLKK